MFYYFDELGSTIDEGRNAKYGHGDVIVAEFQTAGRGQRGRRWNSPRGENLMFSVVLETSFLRADEQFLLLQAVALALVDMLADYGIDARIKWTNDIYVGDRKVVGVLIDHNVVATDAPGKTGMLARSGVGVGINVNQKEFDPELPNAGSMALATGCDLDRGEVLERFYARLSERFEALKSGRREALQRDYHANIYLLGVEADYALPDGTRFKGTIRGVEPGGELLIETREGLKKFLYREVSFII